MSWKSEVDEIKRRRERAMLQGGDASVQRQHDKGRLTIRERIAALIDDDSFEEIGKAAGASERGENGEFLDFTPANFVLGFAKIDGRRIIVGGEDFTLKGGSPSPAGLRKSVYAEDLALQYKMPLVRLHEGAGGSVGGSGGPSLPGPVFSPSRFKSVGQTLGTLPVASAALGAVAGLPAARLVSSHFSVMSKSTAQLLVAGPAVVERAMGEKLTKDELGGAQVHTRNGAVDNAAEDETEALAQIRRFLSYMPNNVWELAPAISCDDPVDRQEEALIEIVPRERRRAFDMRRVLSLILDRDSFFEMGKGYGRSQITGLARLNGHVIGVWANDGRHLAGSMTADGAQKAQRFIELCETFHIPIVAFVDEPGFMIGSKAEQQATIRHGARTVITAAMTTVPWASVMVRRSFGVAQAAHYGPDAYVLAWPSAESGPLPVEGGVAVAFRREIAAAEDPDAKRQELEDMLAARQSPFPRSEALAVHELIDPRETRPMLCKWLDRVQGQLPHLLGPRTFALRP
ncbi:propionyl-CoA carboxylase [Henriciella mobilis]|uniref:acyl-CoA carboxylase subunit beta n=1 Tax=Henriciella mobilis TaxID=2305467 RepID=UPI000E66B63B|nr:carboxyl transferase domain-containing protein [Henriciella mobilis]RIJ14336.1 propionyl-CoA carboxylase [Henriciella mobilis]RIJ19836.1 propionyl-CoA carboxylase [Henriciella mobilis]